MISTKYRVCCKLYKLDLKNPKRGRRYREARMHFSAVLRSTATILLATIVDAVPHVADLGAATILTDNDLYGM
jgi:hypothetical protein